MQIGYTGTSNSLLASGIYGIVKVVSTSIFVFFLVDSLGRKMSLFISSMGMGVLFFIIGALLKVYPPPANNGGNPPSASKAMAAMLYIYVCFYSLGWGPLPYVCSRFQIQSRLNPMSRQMGLRCRHLSNKNKTLWASHRKRVTMAFQWASVPSIDVDSTYVHFIVRDQTLCSPR